MIGNFKKWVNSNPVWVSFILLIIYFLPFCVMGEDSYIMIHDNLDSAISRIKIIFDNNAMFNPEQILPVMDGLPRKLFPGMMNVKMWIFMFSPCFWAYIINAFIVKSVALYGMFLLLIDYVIRNNKWLCSIVALSFALIPFYTDYDLSSAGIPLILWAFFNLYNNKNIEVSYVLIILFPFYSSLVLSGIFLSLFLSTLCIIKICKEGKVFSHFFYGMILLCILYIIVNFDLFEQFFISSNYVSHRTEFITQSSFNDIVVDTFDLVMYSQYHAGKCCAWIIIFVFGVSCYFNYSKFKIYILFIFIAIISLIFTARLFTLLLPNIRLLQEFQFDRFYFLLPTAYFIMLASALSDLYVYKKKMIAFVILLFICAYNVIFDVEFRTTALKIIGMDNNQSPTYKQFFDENLFSQITKSLNIKDTSKCKTVVLGIHPAITEFNGFYTLDSYKANYPLEYKHKFRKVIAKELEKDESIKDYFDKWGSRCYVFSSELGKQYLYGKNSNKRYVEHLQIDIETLKNLGCDYIFSAVKINNADQLKIKYISRYTTPDSFWEIYVYKV